MTTCKSLLIICWLALLAACQPSTKSTVFRSNWPELTRVWIGPDYWANPLQDWQLNEGKLACVTSGGDRNVYLLTHELDSMNGDLSMQITIGPMVEELSQGWVGFKVGVKGEFNDYRDNAVRGEGLPVGITGEGKLFIGSLDPNAPVINLNEAPFTLLLTASPEGSHHYQLQFEILDDSNQSIAVYTRNEIASHWMTGGLALVCSAALPKEVDHERLDLPYPVGGTEDNTERTGNFRFWFRDWQISGSKLKYYPERSFGPVLFTQFTVSDQNLKLTAQFPPIGEQDTREVTLEIESKGEGWQPVATSEIDPLSRTATFSQALSPDYQELSYRIHYRLNGAAEAPEDYYFQGTIPKEPRKKSPLTVAAFTGNNDLGFPNSDLVRSVELQQPDFLFFSGDQIYEGVGGYGAQRAPLEEAALDYLRKWYMFGWTYRDLLRNIPSVAIPDDHDVYHGNIWGEAGKAASKEGTHHEQQDSGGYKMFPDWVNMVQRTQTSHLPDPFDPTPVQQGIGVYYTNLEYAGISFAILEDRKFKSAPRGLLPKGEITNGWSQNPDFDPVIEADHPRAVLLGERQHEFLNWWVENWSEDTWMKVVLSQTIFANVATLPRANSNHDNIVPQLRILKEGEYAPDDVPVSDMDSNGWPQTGRNQALGIIRKAFAFHIAGDQHLGSTIQYGIKDFGDAGYAICVPSVSNVWPRRWYPPINPETNSYSGNYKDGFGNHMTVLAVSNPVFTGREPSRLYDRATGYGIVRFNGDNREITIENWPRDANPAHDQPYPGWPITISQKQNFSPPKGAYLPVIQYQGEGEPLIQALTSDGTLVCSIRAFESSTELKVPEPGNYVIRASINQQTQEYEVQATKNMEQRGQLKLEL